jgi:hypothetical protein
MSKRIGIHCHLSIPTGWVSVWEVATAGSEQRLGAKGTPLEKIRGGVVEALARGRGLPLACRARRRYRSRQISVGCVVAQGR